MKDYFCTHCSFVQPGKHTLRAYSVLSRILDPRDEKMSQI